MHPTSAFRSEDRALMAALIDEIGFGMIFAATPDGPRVAHVPLLLVEGALHFHLARGNALTRHLEGANALAVINGPDGYVSARWYADPQQVPTWNYVALECEGRVRRLPEDALIGQIAALSARHEARVTGGEPWTLDKLAKPRLHAMLGGITGFVLDVTAWRPTIKLSQNKSHEERALLADGLEAQGATAIAHMMRQLASRI